MRLKLEIEPRPISTWGITLASRLPKQEWDDLRAKVYRAAGYKCEICKDGDSTLNCHEVWGFKEDKRIQFLIKCQAICTLCHDVKHFGRSNGVYKKTYVETLISHWCKINKRTKADFQIYLKEIFRLNKKRADRFYIVKVGHRILT